jgi:hypothetical protein
MIPQEKIAAATRGLSEAFGVAAFDDIRDLTERPGSNRAFRIVVRGSAYLLRINTRAGDVSRHFGCMQAAAEAGLAPRVPYTSAEDRISITDFVEAVPLPAADALSRLPAALRTLHALPPFPVVPFNTTCTFLLSKGPALDGFLQKFRGANILPEHDLVELLSQCEQLAAAYSSLDPAPAPSHNDLFKPDNMLFDGSSLWMVDWEAAFQNDRYADLAVLANMLVANETEEETYLQEYFGGIWWGDSWSDGTGTFKPTISKYQFPSGRQFSYRDRDATLFVTRLVNVPPVLSFIAFSGVFPSHPRALYQESAIGIRRI